MKTVDLSHEWHQFLFYRDLQRELVNSREFQEVIRDRLLQALPPEIRLALLVPEINYYWQYHSLADVGYCVMTLNHGAASCVINNNLIVGEFLTAVHTLTGIEYVAIYNTNQVHQWECKNGKWHCY